jgi:adenylate cyclase
MGDGVNIASRLEGAATPGTICLSEDSYRQVKTRLDLAVSDLGETKLKNISEPMRIYSLQVGIAADAKPPPQAVSVVSGAPMGLPDKPSIAVLPFTNMSGDPEQEYFVDGMVEDIITALSRFDQLFVIARNSTFTYKGRAVDVRLVARELGVRYVLEGGVRKSGTRLRITGQLIDAATGAHLWADRFDGSLEDVFDLQDRITANVVGAIEPTLRKAEIERARRKPVENLDAYDLYLRALPHVYAALPDENLVGLDLLNKAIDLAPTYAPALAHAAWCLTQRVTRGWPSAGADDVATATGLARRAAAAGGDDAVALVLAGFVLVMGDAGVRRRSRHRAPRGRAKPRLGFRQRLRRFRVGFRRRSGERPDLSGASNEARPTGSRVLHVSRCCRNWPSLQWPPRTSLGVSHALGRPQS